MDKLVIENKIESLRKCILRVEQRRPDTIELLLQDIDAQDVLVLNLSRAVQSDFKLFAQQIMESINT